MSIIDKSKVKNLPAHAQIQPVEGRIYAYFAYCFSIKGKRKQERDYIGTIDPRTMTFIPNGFFLREKPSFHQRALSRWRDPDKRKREENKKLRKGTKKEALTVNFIDFVPSPEEIDTLNSILNQIAEAVDNLLKNQSSDQTQALTEKVNLAASQAIEALLKKKPTFKELSEKLSSSIELIGQAQIKSKKGKKTLTVDEINLYLLSLVYGQLSQNITLVLHLLQHPSIHDSVISTLTSTLRDMQDSFRSIADQLKKQIEPGDLKNALLIEQILNKATPEE